MDVRAAPCSDAIVRARGGRRRQCGVRRRQCRAPASCRCGPVAVFGRIIGMDLLAPRTLLPEDPATAELAAGEDPVQVATAHPASSAAWAALADEALDRGFPVEAYAYARTGYHRGL